MVTWKFKKIDGSDLLVNINTQYLTHHIWHKSVLFPELAFLLMVYFPMSPCCTLIL